MGQRSTSARRCGTPRTDRVRGRSRRHGGRTDRRGEITVDDREDSLEEIAAPSSPIGPRRCPDAVPPALGRVYGRADDDVAAFTEPTAESARRHLSDGRSASERLVTTAQRTGTAM
ncbi:hypothetical protein C9J85_06480 [Haloferax sp. wsp5]|nr:hypothetical protein C9J85_06480 [Haloferax sp. wsp5]